MADTTLVTKLLETTHIYDVVYSVVSDGTGGTTIVVDRSALTGSPTYLRILKAEWCMQGLTRVTLQFDHDTDQVALILSGTGKMCFKDAGGLKDAGAAGGTGDILAVALAGANLGTATVHLTVGK